MNDLYIAPDARGQALAEALIDRCQIESAHHGAAKLTWITRPDNHRAQAVYDQLGAHHDPSVNYRIDLPAGPSGTPTTKSAIGPATEREQHLPKLLGVELDHVDGQSVTARLAIRAELRAPTGYLHAATLVALADTACGYGTLAGLPETATGFTTLELKTNFLATAQSGVLLCHAHGATVEARPRFGTRRLAATSACSHCFAVPSSCSTDGNRWHGWTERLDPSTAIKRG